jgi:hypothetical protein
MKVDPHPRRSFGKIQLLCRLTSGWNGFGHTESRFMVTLDAILDDAKHHPSFANTTVLNADQFHTIRGPSSTIFRARLDAALAGSADLMKVQQLNTSEGLEVVEPVQAGIHGGYWYLRNLTHNGETFPAGEGRYRSLVEALEAAIQWWQAETWCRGVIVRNYDVKHSNGSL